MRILVFGAGPLGSLKATRLHEAGHDVSLLARGQRLADLREHGVVVHEQGADRVDVAHVPVVETFEADDDYDLVLIVMGEHQFTGILDTLAENEHVQTVCFMGNAVNGPEEMVRVLGNERVMLGFPYPGGKRDGHVVCVLPIDEQNEYTIPIGEADGTIRPRTREVAAVLSDMRGYDVEIRTDMDEWLKYHVALLISGLAPALYAADTEMRRLGETRDLLVLSVRATKEALRGLREAGYSPSPRVVRGFEYVPEPVCVWAIGWLMRTEYAKISIEGHTRAGREEMTHLFDGLVSIVEGGGGTTDAMDRLAPYFDPDTSPYPEGRRDIPMKWGGVIAPALGVGALAVALRRLRSKPTATPPVEGEYGTVQYEVVGPEDATPVVFTHGFALDRGTWREQVATLSESYRVLSWDLPGCGDSAESSDPARFDVASQSLLDVLDEQGVDRAVLVGQSMGSLLSQYVAYHHPDRVRALVHVGGFPLYGGVSDHTIKLMGLHVWALKRMPERLLCDLFGRFVARSPEARAYARRASARTGKENMVSLERALLGDLGDGIPEPTEHPQLVVVGEEEHFWLRKKAREWDETLLDSEYETVPDAGHLVNHDNPTVFNEILSSFLESLD